MWKNNTSEMRGLPDVGPNVPAFLIKLWKLVDDPETDELICWSESGSSFIISAQAQFARELLPLYYKHNNMASFIRQLNMYGFHKIVSVEAGGLKNEKDEMEFAHQCFIKDHPYLLVNIKRKLSNSKLGLVQSEEVITTSGKSGIQPEVLAKVLSDVNNLKGKQESWDARLAAMKRENEALWRELAIFRQKHLKQEQIINKLIHFIVTIVQPSRNVSLRRRYPLMLNEPIKKITKLSGADTSSHVSVGSPTGPTIHEIDTADVLFSSEQNEDSSSNAEFISTELSEPSTSFVEVVSPASHASVADTAAVIESPADMGRNTTDDWLEIELTDDDLITNPLTPIDPAKVNPAVAAATLRSLEVPSDIVNTPITITIPAIPNTNETVKKSGTGKKTIYLPNGKAAPKKNMKKPTSVGVKISGKKTSLKDFNSEVTSTPTDLLLDLVCGDGDQSSNFEGAATEVDKPSTSKGTTYIRLNQNRTKTGNKGEMVAKSSSKDPLLKLESLYKGEIEESPPPSKKVKVALTDRTTGENLLCIEDSGCSTPEQPTDINLEELTSQEPELTDPAFASGSSSMAVVCQQPGQPSHEDLTSELTTHVDSMQGEIDYLKEILKGEGYNLDANTLLGLFNDDPLAFGMPPLDEDNSRGKENSSGSELMTYGAQPNLIDLVDLFGATPSNQDWSNVLSPASPPQTELATPAPSPKPPSFPVSTKRRKK